MTMIVRMTILMALVAVAGGQLNAQDASTPAANAARASGMPTGMKQYWFVMLVRGPKRDEPITPERAAELQAGHMAHMTAQHAAGRLVMAGPFGDDGPWRGLQIFDAGSQAEVEAICGEDPSVKAGRLACEVHPWWGEVGTALK